MHKLTNIFTEDTGISFEMSRVQFEIKGTQDFMGIKLPIVSGGFGEDKKCISDKTVAEIHGMKVFHVRELITRNAKRFKDEIDILDLQRIALNDTLEKERVNEMHMLEFLQNLGYAKQSITQAEIGLPQSHWL